MSWSETVGELRPVPDVDPDLMRAVARSMPRADSKAPSVELVDLVATLVGLSRDITEHNRRVMAGEQADWSRLADKLTKAARVCRQHATPKLDNGKGDVDNK